MPAGLLPNPTYDQVCDGYTGHAEVLKVDYDPKVITLDTLLDVFFTMHDPTTLNRQGADFGTQYRSIILYTSDKQKEAAREVHKEHTQKEFQAPDSHRGQEARQILPGRGIPQALLRKECETSPTAPP